VSSSTAVVVLSPENWRSRLAHWTKGEALLQHEDKILLLLTLIIGAVVGLVVAAFIFVTENLGARMYPAGGAAWRRVLIPTGGALITGYLLSRFFTNARGSGIPQTKAALFLREGFISLRTVLGKFGCCSASLASGIALGREGPSVQVGAGIASVLGRRLGLGPNRIRELIPVGAAAGGFQHTRGSRAVHARRSDGRSARTGARLYRSRLRNILGYAAPAARR
jgi:H+/Cl- antiporter ClcA